MATASPSVAERERRAAQRQADTARTVFAETPTVDLPGIGTVQLRFRNADLAMVERRLYPLLSELPEKRQGEWRDAKGKAVPEGTDGATWHTHANVWDAMEVLGQTFPLDTVGVLLYAAVRHAGITEEQIEELPPSVYRDAGIETSLGVAMAVAFGAGVGEEDDAGRPTGAASPAASTGPAS